MTDQISKSDFVKIQIQLINSKFLEIHPRYGIRPTRLGAQKVAIYLNNSESAAHTHQAYIDEMMSRSNLNLAQIRLEATVFSLVDMFREGHLND